MTPYYINKKTNFIAFFIQLLIFLTEERYNVFLYKDEMINLHGL